MSDLGISAGTAFVEIRPNLANFGGQLSAGVQQATQQAGAALSGGLNAAASQAASSSAAMSRSLMTLGTQMGPLGQQFTQLGNSIVLGMNTASTAAESARARIGSALQGIGLAATGVGAALQALAGPLEKATAGLQQTVENTGASFDDYAKQISAAEKGQAKYGFTSTDTANALARLVGATGSVDEALKELNDATILAKVKHEDLTTAATQLAAAHAGNFRAFKQLGINITGVADATKKAEAADKAYTATVQSLQDAQTKLSNFEDQLAQKRQAAQEAYANNVQNANDKIASAEQHVSDLRQQFADADAAAAQRIADAEDNLANVRQNAADNAVAAQQRIADAIQAVSDAQAQAADNQAQANQSIIDAEQRLADVQASQAVTGNSRAAAALSRQVALRDAQQNVVRAQQHALEVGEAGDKSVSKAEDNVGKAQAAADKQAETDATAVAKAQAALTKAQTDQVTQIKREDEELLKAQQDVLKAQAELAKIVQKGDGSTPTLAEQQQEATLQEDLTKAQKKEADAKAAKDQADADAADNQRKFKEATTQAEQRYGGVPQAQSKTWAGKIDALLAGIKNFLAGVGEKLAVPAMAAGPFLGLAGTIWALRRFKGAGGGGGAAGGEGGSAGAEAGGITTTVEGEGLGALDAGLPLGADVGAAFGAAGPELAGGLGGAAEGGALAGLGSAAAAAAAPVGLLAASVAALAGGFKLVTGENWRHSFEDAIASLNPFGLAISLWRDHTKGELGKASKDVGNWSEDVISHVKGSWDTVSRDTKNWGRDFNSDVSGFWNNSYHDAVNWGDNTIGKAKGSWDTVSRDAKAWGRDFNSDVAGFWNNTYHDIVNWGDNTTKWLKGIWDTVSRDAKAWAGDFGKIFEGAWGDVTSGFSRALAAIGKPIAGFFNLTADVADKVGAGPIAQKLHDAANSILSATGAGGGGSGEGGSVGGGGGGGQVTHLATGGGLGRTPIGDGFVTSEETAIVHEGGPHPEFVVPTDPAHRPNALRLFKALGAKLMAAGGIVGEAQTWLGVPYLWGGGHDPSQSESDVRLMGLDCSGLTSWVLHKLGINAWGNTTAQLQMGQRVPGIGAASPGDLVFFGSSPEAQDPEHVGIYVGDGQMIDAPHTGAFVRQEGIEGFGAIDGVRRFDAGGGGGGGIGGFFSGIGSAIGGALSDASDAFGAARRFVADALGAVPKLPESDDILGLLPASANLLRQDLIDLIAGGAQGGAGTGEGSFRPSGPPPSGQVSDWILAGLQLAGKPDSWASPMYDIAMHESSGDAHSENDYDSNAAAGHPSKGLFQTIDSTFQEYMVAGHGDIWNPVDNTAAAAGYIASRYGDPWHTPGELSEAAGGPYQGYARGGVLGAHWAGVMDQGGTVPPGVFVGVNQTGRDETLRPDAGGIDYRRLAVEVATELGRTLARAPIEVNVDSKRLSRSLQDRRMAYS